LFFMAVHIRLARYGRKHTPLYRVVAIDSRRAREGKACEVLGTYNPAPADKNIQVDIEAVHKWVLSGAQYSSSVESLLKRAGYETLPEGVADKRAAQKAKAKAKYAKRQKKDGKFVAVSARAQKKFNAKAKAARKAEAEAALAAHKAAKEAAAAEGEGSEEAAEG
jgi:small subunit ribosomal protein S16